MLEGKIILTLNITRSGSIDSRKQNTVQQKTLSGNRSVFSIMRGGGNLVVAKGKTVTTMIWLFQRKSGVSLFCLMKI